ncbi:MAG: ribosome silencing factor [Gammaproteobacteria bacterium]|nr:ribosome silencing factor [Gammaproteobacteria bacterium]
MPKKKLTEICKDSLLDSKAEDILNLDVKGISSFADQIIIATANSNRHAKSVSEKLVDKLKQDKIHIIGVDGQVESGWILVDCGSIVINIMKKEEREFYDLEGLWGEKTLLDASK